MNPGFKTIASGGDGTVVQYCQSLCDYSYRLRSVLTSVVGFVGYDPVLKMIIVSHQGTDFSKMYVHVSSACIIKRLIPLICNSIPAVTDADFFLTPLNPILYPGIDSSIQVHNGFGNSQAA
jgi:hypothetical protein